MFSSPLGKKTDQIICCSANRNQCGANGWGGGGERVHRRVQPPSILISFKVLEIRSGTAGSSNRFDLLPFVLDKAKAESFSLEVGVWSLLQEVPQWKRCSADDEAGDSVDTRPSPSSRCLSRARHLFPVEAKVAVLEVT